MQRIIQRFRGEDLEIMEKPTELRTADPRTKAELQGNLLQDYELKFEQLPEDQKCPNCAPKPILHYTSRKKPDDMKNLQSAWSWM